LPPTYWQLAAGRWPYAYWLPTTEPTSDGLDGVAVHAFAHAGPAMTLPGLPADLWPFALDGQQVFAVATSGAIRYLDLEVDQWLTVAPDFDAFLAQLQWRAPSLAAPFSAQQLAHALLVTDAASLPPLLTELRERHDWPTYCAWLGYLGQQAPLRQVAQEEYCFAQKYLPLTAPQKAALAQVFAAPR
jgi:hypothetical protein